MQGRLINLTLSLSGKQQVTVEIDDDFRSKYDQLKEAPVEITIKKAHPKRSLTANAYAWVLIDKIAQRMRLTKKEVYRNAIRDVGGVSSQVTIPTKEAAGWKAMWESFGLGWQVEEFDCEIPGWTNFTCYKGSSVYDTAQMAALIDSLVQEAQTLGIETKTEEEIKSLIGG